MQITALDSVTLWKMYIWSGVKALEELKEGDGVVILRTAGGQEHRFEVFREDPDKTVDRMVDRLKQTGETHVAYLTMMWGNHWLDVPSGKMVKALIELNRENVETKVLLIGQENFLIKTLADMT